MSRYLGPRRKLEVRFGLRPPKNTTTAKTRRQSEYGAMLTEKQKLRFLYGIMERQFARYVEAAQKQPNPAESLLTSLETRLDNAVYRLGWARTRRQARQLCAHGLVRLNSVKVNIPSMRVYPGDDLELREEYFDRRHSEGLLPVPTDRPPVSWLRPRRHLARVLSNPTRTDLRQDIDMNKIFEFYSK